MRRLVVEPVPGEREAAERATALELAAVRGFAPERRREYLAWRAVVRREVGADARIDYDAAGAPVVVNYPVHISVAHCRGRVAVCFSDARCAVDIEPAGRDFSRAAVRYLSHAERALSDDPLFPVAAWCAKEAMYKYSGRNGLDLVRDLRIECADLTAGKLTGRIEHGEPVELSVQCQDGFVVVYIL